MLDHKSKAGEPDRGRAAAHERYEMAYLRQKAGVSEMDIRATINKLGNNRAKIERELKRNQ